MTGRYLSGFQLKYHYTMTNAYDHKNRRIFKSFLDYGADGAPGGGDDTEAQRFFYYDVKDRLVEIKHTPNIASPSTYSLFRYQWLGNRPILFTQYNVDGWWSSTYYYHSDHQNRPVEAYNFAWFGASSTRQWP